METFTEQKDKIILITGASKGLGRELALSLSTNNSKLILVARKFKLLLTLQSEIKNRTGIVPEVVQCDVSKPDEVKNLAIFIKKKYHKLDVLINNAAIAVHKKSESMKYLEIKHQFEVNFFGAFNCIQEMIPLLKIGQKGYILNIGSIADRAPFAFNSIYAATKSALRTYSRGLQLEMKKYGIKVGVLYPGIMNTSFQVDRRDSIQKLPSFMILDTKKIVVEIRRMIALRKSKSYMYRWMIWLMKIKLLIS